MKYTPYCSHGNDPLLAIERYTHTMSSGVPAGPGRIDVSIRCSRNEQRQLPSLLTQHSPTATFQSVQSGKGLRSVSPSREKGRGHRQATNEEELPPNSRSSSAAALYMYETIVGLNSGELQRQQSSAAKATPSSFKETKPTHSVKVYVSSPTGASIAPAGVRAVVTQRLRPITSNTMVKGKGMVTVIR